MQILDALATKDTRMLATVEMLDPMIVLLAKVWLQLSSILLVFQLNVSLEALLKVD